MSDQQSHLSIAVYIFPGITALDAIGPYEVLARLPGAKLQFVGKERGMVRTDNNVLGLNVDATLDEVQRADILVVPGGFATRILEDDPVTLDWIRKIHETTKWTTSVCTGSILLAAAGLLKGLEATTHWAAMDSLEKYGAKPTSRRVVRQGKIITAAGVSSGIDMALTLAELEAGTAVAQAIQLSIEYDPEPPLDAGSVDKAPAPVVEMIRQVMAKRMQEQVATHS